MITYYHYSPHLSKVHPRFRTPYYPADPPAHSQQDVSNISWRPCKNIKSGITKTNVPTPYVRLPPPKTPRLIDILLVQAIKNNLSDKNQENNSNMQKKKAWYADSLSMATENGTNNTQVSTATTYPKWYLLSKQT